jgi:DNA-binding NarL/FixJ family response regulator
MTAPHTSVIRILLADDHALVRRGVRLILDRRPAPFVTDLGAPLTASV